MSNDGTTPCVSGWDASYARVYRFPSQRRCTRFVCGSLCTTTTSRLSPMIELLPIAEQNRPPQQAVRCATIVLLVARRRSRVTWLIALVGQPSTRNGRSRVAPRLSLRFCVGHWASQYATTPLSQGINPVLT